MIIRRISLTVAVSGLLLAAIAASLALGAVRIPLEEVMHSLFGGQVNQISEEIISNLRLPRTISAIAVGAALGTAGALLQGGLGNPLASPDIIGVTGGASFGAMLIILVNPGSIALLPVAAIVFGLLAAALVIMVSWTGPNRGGVGRLILSGIAIGAVFMAGTTGLMAVFPSRVPSAAYWLAGGLVSEGWDTIRAVGPYIAVALVVALALIRPLDRLALGDDVATSLGTHPRLIRVASVCCAAVLAAVSAAVAGLLGFIGILVPHLVRLLGGTSAHGFVIPISTLTGATLLTAADTLARTVWAPNELPVGPFMVLIGVPLFLWLLRKAI